MVQSHVFKQTWRQRNNDGIIFVLNYKIYFLCFQTVLRMSSTVAMALVTVSLAPGSVMVTMTVETSVMSKAVVGFSKCIVKMNCHVFV